jgi:hypothetical protein
LLPCRRALAFAGWLFGGIDSKPLFNENFY